MAQSTPEKDPLSLFEELKLIRHCPMCSTAYGGSEVHLFESTPNSHFFHLTCLECQGSLLGIVVVNDLGMSSVYTVTDLSVVDIALKRTPQSISEEDVLGFHEYLQEKHRFETAILVA